MVKVAVAEFRAHMAKYLAYVMDGQVVILTSHGRAVAELKQPVDQRELAKSRLAEIAAEASIGDVVSPVVDDLEAM